MIPLLIVMINKDINIDNLSSFIYRVKSWVTYCIMPHHHKPNIKQVQQWLVDWFSPQYHLQSMHQNVLLVSWKAEI